MEFIPVALACGHVLQGQAWFEAGGGKPARVECPEGCGMVEFVVEPSEGRLYGDPPPERLILDLGHLEAGDTVEIDLEDERA